MSAAGMIRTSLYALFFFLVLLACGCGGGGAGASAQAGNVVNPASSFTGASNAAVVTAANAEALAMGAFFGGQIGAEVGAIGAARTSTAREASAVPVRDLTQVLKLTARRFAITQKAAELKKLKAKATGKQLARSISTQIPGDNGGTAAYTLEVNDSTGSFYGSVNFQSFTSSGTVVDGHCDMLGTLDANRQDLSQLTLSFSSLTMTDNNLTYGLVGNLSWSFTYASGSEMMTMNMVLKAAQNKTYWFKDYRIATSYGATSLTQSMTGRYYDHDHGFIDLSTETELLVDTGAAWPRQGVLVGSAANRWVKIRFLANTCRIEAETNGDGVADWQEEMQSNPVVVVNHAPVAQAGPDQSASVGNLVQLDGSSSSDPDGNTLSYYWSFTTVPPGSGYYGLSGYNTATPSFTPAVAGTYQVSLTIYDGVYSNSDTVSIVVTAAVPSQPAAFKKAWQFGTYGSCIGEAGLLTADLDGDGVNEIIASAATGGFGDNTLWYVVKKNGSGGFDQVWRSENYGVSIVRILLADLNRDGKDDVVVALSDGTIHIYDGPTLSELTGMQVAGSLKDMAVADLDGDGHLELATTDGSAVRVYNAETGVLKWNKTGCGGNSLAVGNTDSDAALEVVTTSYSGKGYVLDGISGNVKWEYLNGFGAQVRLADLDGDGMQEIIGASAWYKITIFDADVKSPAWEIPTSLDIGAVLVTDVNGDGIPEILYGENQGSNVHAIDARTHQQKWVVNCQDGGVSGIAFGDVDQDGNKELLWAAGGNSTGADYLYVADGTTRTVKWKNKDFNGLTSLALGDLNNDGSNQLLVVTTDSNSGYDGGIIDLFEAQSHALSYQQPLGFEDWMGDSRAVRIGDVDGDGKNEFVISTSNLYDGIVRVYDGATRTMKRQSAGYNGNYFSALALGDVDGDGKVEIVAGQGREHTGAPGTYLIVFDPVTMQEKWKSVDLGGYWAGVYDIKLGDLDKDGHQDIIASVGGSRLMVFDGVTHVQKLLIESPARALEVADVDGDGFPEVLVGRTDGRIDVYDGVTFAVKKTVGTFGTAAVDALKVADLDGNGTLKWLVASGGVLTVLEGDRLYWRSGNLGSSLGRGNSIAVKDTDHDGHPNVFIGTDPVLYQFKYLGAAL